MAIATRIAAFSPALSRIPIGSGQGNAIAARDTSRPAAAMEVPAVRYPASVLAVVRRQSHKPVASAGAPARGKSGDSRCKTASVGPLRATSRPIASTVAKLVSPRPRSRSRATGSSTSGTRRIFPSRPPTAAICATSGKAPRASSVPVPLSAPASRRIRNIAADGTTTPTTIVHGARPIKYRPAP